MDHMTQRRDPHSSEHDPNEGFTGIRREKAIQRARERADFDIDSWHQLNWYVQFMMHDFDNLSNGDLLNVQEEVTALCRVIEHHQGYRPLLTRAELVAVQQKITKPLMGLVDRGRAEFEEFSYKVVIYRLKDLMEKDPSSRTDKSSNVPEVVPDKRFTNCKTRESYTSTVLLLRLIDLLAIYGQSIRRCLKCKHLFLAFRRHAQYCTRQCQSQSAADANRKRKKVLELTARRSRNKRPASVPLRRK